MRRNFRNEWATSTWREPNAGDANAVRSWISLSRDAQANWKATQQMDFFSSLLAVFQHRCHQDDQHAQDQRGFLKREVFEGFAVAEFFEVEEVEGQ